MEIRLALHHLGEITEEITTDDLLDIPPAVGQVSSASSALPAVPEAGGWLAGCPPKEGIGKQLSAISFWGIIGTRIS